MNVWYLKVPGFERGSACWFDTVSKWLSTRGPVETIRQVKACRLAYTRYLAGQPFTDGADLGIALTAEGLPVSLGDLLPLARKGGTAAVRAILTVMLVSRVLPGNKPPDLSSVTAPSTSTKPLDDIRREVGVAMKKTGWRVARPVWDKPHLSTKAGPNGQAMLGAMQDAHLLTPDALTYIKVLGGDKVISLIETLRTFSLSSWLQRYPHKGPSLLRKLSVVKDKEAKSRVIAILDYWTQTSLVPLHRAVFGLLRTIREDCTFNQASFLEVLPRHGPYYSFDLTSATDRFPVQFQVEVLSHLVSREYAEAWEKALTSQPFYVPWTGGSVYYRCGQPMGAYSSWAVFAISHHVAVWVAGQRASVDPRGRYALLGDDIVIADDAIACQYRQLMAELGVSISEAKTHVSQDTYEFAKRWVHNGEEVTGAPISSLFQGPKLKWFVAAEFVRGLEVRWSRSCSFASRRLFAELYTSWGVSPGYAQRLAQKAYNFFQLPVKGESYQVRLAKADYFNREFFDGIIGCNRYKFALTLMWEWLAEAKTNVIEEAIKQQTKLLNQFLADLGKLAGLLPEGLDSQSALTALVPVRVVLDNLGDLQQAFEKLRSDFTSGRERSIVMDSAHYRTSVDPTRVFSKRASHLVLYSQASLVNKFRKLAAIYVAGRRDYISQGPEVDLPSD